MGSENGEMGVRSSVLLPTGSVTSSSTLLAAMESSGWKQLVRVPRMKSEEKSAQMVSEGHDFCLQKQENV